MNASPSPRTAVGRTPGATPPAPPASLGLEARLAAVEAEMTLRLETASLAFSIDSHIDAEPVDWADVVRVPDALPDPQPAPLPTSYTTPVATVLHLAHTRLETGGWCAGQRRDEDGSLCLYGAIHAVAPGPGIEHRALDVLLDAIRRRFPGTASVPEFNDSFSHPRTPLRVLREAADLADARGL
ncbi:DUF6197 family protein [Streptomyces chilikensis]|uniref:DUF6197 family protein n=1 Tax=Streptomyces chilikensis TaxID=1194079 RepID=UPI000A6E9530|nr:hypothetical protein [Streptomyces chilikensis]